MISGILRSINVSKGGVPKLPRDACVVRTSGLDGDRQRDLRYHGGPDRAVSFYSEDLIDALRADGHPVTAGAMGENLTVAGVPWEVMTPGARVDVGDVSILLTSYAHPCRNITAAFRDGDMTRVSNKVNPGWSRVYGRVTKEGTIRVGDIVRVVGAGEADA